MVRHETSEDIDRAAADWAARIDRGPLSPAEQRTLDVWTAADPRRFGALARALAILAHFDPPEAVDPVDELREARTRRRSRDLRRREFLQRGAAIAASAASVSLGAGWFLSGLGQFQTAKGEVRSVPLEDGSVIWLNTDSAVKVRYSRGARAVVLTRGEAMFDVAKDPARPFIVRAADTNVRAVGTSFSVSHVADRRVLVLVNEGLVDFGPAAAGAPTRLVPGCRALSGAAGRIEVVHVGTAKVSRALSWRRGQLDFDGVSLAQAAATFAKYSDEQILIDDPAVARMTVTGLFSSTDPVGFAKAVAVSLDLKARSEPDGVHLSR